jgi:predicted SAM-dependent methyltransferase
MLISVLEHLVEAKFVIQSVWRLLRPSGLLLVSVPTCVGKRFLELSASRLGLSPKVEIEDHKMHYGKRDLWPILVRSGLKPSQILLKYHKFGLNLFAVAERPTLPSMANGLIHVHSLN